MELYVHRCHAITARKGPTQHLHAPLQQSVSVDILGLFLTTDQEDCYVLVAMEYFMKWRRSYVVPDKSACQDLVIIDKFNIFSVMNHHSNSVHTLAAVNTSLRANKARSVKLQIFSVLAPKWLNGLLTNVRTAESFTIFRKILKTHLFRLTLPLIA